MAGSVTDKLITLGELKVGLDTKVDKTEGVVKSDIVNNLTIDDASKAASQKEAYDLNIKTDFVFEQQYGDFTVPTSGTYTSIASQTFVKSGYKPICFGLYGGSYADVCAISANGMYIDMLNNSVVTGTIYIRNVANQSAGNAGRVVIPILWQKII